MPDREFHTRYTQPWLENPFALLVSGTLIIYIPVTWSLMKHLFKGCLVK